MQMTNGPHDNLWRVDGAPVRKVIIYAAGEILLEIDSFCIWNDRPGSQAIQSLDDVTAIGNRRIVNLTRPEHFFCQHTLYLNAALFDGYSTVYERPLTDSETEVTYIRCIDIMMRVNGEAEARQVRVSAAYTHRSELTRLGAAATALATVFNAKVADHSNRHLSVYAAARLLKAMPELVAAAKEHGYVF